MCLAQVIFQSSGITNQMAPPAAVENISNLLISVTEKGSQDANSLMACYKLFDQYLNENNVTRPVVLLSDGHSSRFSFEGLSFLKTKEIYLFLSPPDTTGLLQLLDQLNKGLHLAYKNEKDKLFSQFQTVNREAFMVILGNVWESWTTKSAIVKAAKRVGVTSLGLSVDHMQQDKFMQASNCMEQGSTTSSSSSAISSPKHARRNSAAYWKDKFNQSQDLIREMSEKSIDLEEVPGFMTIEKVKPNLSKQTTRITQVHGSMQGKDVITMVETVKKKKEDLEKKKEERAEKQAGDRQAFYKCKFQCVCEERKCAALGLKECSKCGNILRSVCSKAGCKEDQQKPFMILPAAALKPKARKPLVFRKEEEYSSQEEEDSSQEEEESSGVEEEPSVEEEGG